MNRQSKQTKGKKEKAKEGMELGKENQDWVRLVLLQLVCLT